MAAEHPRVRQRACFRHPRIYREKWQKSSVPRRLRRSRRGKPSPPAVPVPAPRFQCCPLPRQARTVRRSLRYCHQKEPPDAAQWYPAEKAVLPPASAADPHPHPKIRRAGCMQWCGSYIPWSFHTFPSIRPAYRTHRISFRSVRRFQIRRSATRAWLQR